MASQKPANCINPAVRLSGSVVPVVPAAWNLGWNQFGTSSRCFWDVRGSVVPWFYREPQERNHHGDTVKPGTDLGSLSEVDGYALGGAWC
jgi:hypothetical protein